MQNIDNKSSLYYGAGKLLLCGIGNWSFKFDTKERAKKKRLTQYQMKFVFIFFLNKISNAQHIHTKIQINKLFRHYFATQSLIIYESYTRIHFTVCTYLDNLVHQ